MRVLAHAKLVARAVLARGMSLHYRGMYGCKFRLVWQWVLDSAWGRILCRLDRCRFVVR